jgi:hypothetical protein
MVMVRVLAGAVVVDPALPLLAISHAAVATVVDVPPAPRQEIWATPRSRRRWPESGAR